MIVKTFLLRADSRRRGPKPVLPAGRTISNRSARGPEQHNTVLLLHLRLGRDAGAAAAPVLQLLVPGQQHGGAAGRAATPRLLPRLHTPH